MGKQCKDIHEKIPKQVTIQVPVHDCHSRNTEKIRGNGVLDNVISNGLDNIVFEDSKIDSHINNGIIAQSTFELRYPAYPYLPNDLITTIDFFKNKTDSIRKLLVYLKFFYLPSAFDILLFFLDVDS